MTDNDTPNEGDNDNLADEGNDTPDSSYKKLKAVNDKLEDKLQAQSNQASAERRKFEDRIKAFEANDDEPKDSERIANLEVQLARSKAVSKYGLSENDAELLKGSPDQILEDASYWADRLKEINPKGQSNKDMIDDKLKDKGGDIPPKPDPKKSKLSWMDEYKAAGPSRRDEMDKLVMDGEVNPRSSK